MLVLAPHLETRYSGLRLIGDVLVVAWQEAQANEVQDFDHLAWRPDWRDSEAETPPCFRAHGRSAGRFRHHQIAEDASKPLQQLHKWVPELPVCCVKERNPVSLFQDLRRLSVERGQELLVFLDRELDLGALKLVILQGLVCLRSPYQPHQPKLLPHR